MIPPVRTVAPATFLSAADARAVLGTDSAQDTLLAACIAAVVSRLDGYRGYLWRCIGSQTWRQGFLEWEEINLELGDVQSITTITYTDTAGASQTVSSDLYFLRGSAVIFREAFTYPQVGEAASPIQVTYVAGFSEIPDDLKNAVIMAAGAKLFTSARDPSIKSEAIPGVATYGYGLDGIASGMSPEAEAIFDRYRLLNP
jgi:uncharacterized phiE125 gp8 family phage protein